MPGEIYAIQPDRIIQFSAAPKNLGSKREVTKLDLENPWSQVLSDTVSLADVFQEKLKEEIRRRKNDEPGPPIIDPEVWEDPEALVEQYADSIEMHVDQRVALFFQMAILCYKMPFHFSSSGEAEEQYGSAPTLKLSEIEGTNHPYEAAHSSTSPCLYACKRSEWDAYQAALAQKKPAQMPTQVVYCKYGYGYQRHNSTNALPKSVNETDSLIDWKMKSQGTILRTSTIALSNKLGTGELDPVQATKVFVRTFKQRVKVVLEHAPNDKVRPVLEKYLEQIKAIQQRIKTSDSFFDELLDIKMGEEDERSALLREVVYKKRFEIIRADQLIDARIKCRLQQANITYKRGESRDYLKFALIMKSVGNERTMLRKLFCKTDAIFDEKYPQTLQNAAQKRRYLAFKKRVEAFTEKHKTVIENLLRDIRCDIREMKRAEQIFRASLFQDLIIKVNKWTRKEFVRQFKQKYDRESMSGPMVSRLTQPARTPRKTVYKTPEGQRYKEMSISKAEKCAKILKVEAGIFFPSVFASTPSI